ncbi:hemerythrin domain-containing protein [Glaesserella sp.]|uniref:hemerythrin domain-containing protein n=1 Tax=Glaesserella sp. TaxID=2094731 RepID=UPI0035A0518B
MLNLDPKPFVSWDEPIEMLYACHSKVKNFCRQLQILPDYIEQHGCNQAVKNDVQQILNYFNLSAPLHHDDEEKDFFPALIELVPQAKADIDELERQHIDLHQNWDILSAQLNALLSGEIANVERDLIQRFVAGYDQHIAIEEPLFELGREHLAHETLQSMGKIMADRRKV